MNYSRAKKVIEATYTDRCTVTEHRKSIDKEHRMKGQQKKWYSL